MATLQGLPQEIFKLTIERVMDQEEPVDFDCFLHAIGPDSIKYRQSLAEVAKDPDEPLNLAALLESAEEASTRSVDNTAWSQRWSPEYSRLRSRYRTRVLQDWRIATMQSRQFRAMGKIAFFERKTFLIAVETAALLRKSALLQLSQRDQRLGIERMRSIFFAIGDEVSPGHLIPLPIRIKGFTSLSRIELVWHGRLDRSWLKRKKAICGEAPREFTSIMTLFGVPTSMLTISLQLHTTAEVDTWEDLKEKLSEEVYPLLRTRARMLGLG